MKKASAYSSLKVALVSDDLTRICLSYECRVINVTPRNGRLVLNYWKPDVLFVESAWGGRWNSWRYKIAAYPDHPDRSNRSLARLVEAARDRNIPTVFWNREDGVHFDRFIGSASLFDHILTVDENMVPRYREIVGSHVSVDVMMFAAQPAIHHPKDGTVMRRASFVGSYGRHIHPERRAWQDMIFRGAKGIGVTVYDRNSRRKADRYRFPEHSWIHIKKGVSHVRTADIYRRYIANLNVNTICDSATAFSRRLVEILACGGFAVTNSTPAVRRLFGDYCRMIDSEDEAKDLFDRLAGEGLSPDDRQRVSAGTDHVLRQHTWRHRLEQIAAVVV